MSCASEKADAEVVCLSKEEVTPPEMETVLMTRKDAKEAGTVQDSPCCSICQVGPPVEV